LIDLIRDKWLCPIRVKTMPLSINLAGCRTTAGDYNDADLGHAIEPYLERIADIVAEHWDRKILVFLPLIALSRRFASLCQARGLTAEHVDGESPDRQEILGRFRRGETHVLSNAMLLTEGYDEPSIDCVVCLRPTQSRSLYSQIVGRGTRIWPGKDHLLLLDFLWLAAEHNLVKPANLVAGDEEEAQAITEALSGDGDLEEAKEKVDVDRAAKLKERLRQNAKRRSRTFDALEFALSINDVDLADFNPTMGWHGEPVSPKQQELLARYGIDADTVTSRGQASAIIDKLFLRMRLGLASAKQVRWLKRLGHPQPELATFEEAKAFLDNAWGGAHVAS
jgi:superfamily II DNA or RNA helicase